MTANGYIRLYEAAATSGLSRQLISYYIGKGKVRVLDFQGIPLVCRVDVMNLSKRKQKAKLSNGK